MDYPMNVLIFHMHRVLKITPVQDHLCSLQGIADVFYNLSAIKKIIGISGSCCISYSWRSAGLVLITIRCICFLHLRLIVGDEKGIMRLKEHQVSYCFHQ